MQMCVLFFAGDEGLTAKFKFITSCSVYASFIQSFTVILKSVFHHYNLIAVTAERHIADNLKANIKILNIFFCISFYDLKNPTGL
jgi:hypothetical protein